MMEAVAKNIGISDDEHLSRRAIILSKENINLGMAAALPNGSLFPLLKMPIN
jgi:hypothetical protein